MAQGNLEGNIVREEGAQVQVRGTLKYTEKGVKTRKVVTEQVAGNKCKVVEDFLT
jgi:hypothetical protein